MLLLQVVTAETRLSGIQVCTKQEKSELELVLGGAQAQLLMKTGQTLSQGLSQTFGGQVSDEPSLASYQLMHELMACFKKLECFCCSSNVGLGI